MPNRLLKQFPRRHLYEGSVAFDIDDETKNSFLLPLVIADRGLTGAEGIVVNPVSDAYSVSAGTDSDESGFSKVRSPFCYLESVVNRINLKFNMSINKTFINPTNTGTQWLPYCVYKTMMICNSFGDLDTTTADGITELKDEMQLLRNESGQNMCLPNFSGIDLPLGSALATLAPTSFPIGGGSGQLTTDRIWEAVAFDEDAFEDKLQDSELNAKMRANSFGGLRTGLLRANNPIVQNRWMSTPPKVKRMNAQTFLGLLIHIPVAGSNEQLLEPEHIAAGGSHVEFRFQVKFNEYHDLFNATSGNAI